MITSFLKYFILRKYYIHPIQSNMDIKTFIFLDSETTGLPFQEHNKTRMTELCFTAVQSEHISVGVFPRIQNKVSFCFNPRKFINPEASRVSGLTNQLLECQTDFNSSCFDIIQKFLDVHRKPICLVAHNGNRFDYPILKAELHKIGNELSSDVYCVDSLLAFRSLYDNSLKTTNVKPKKREVEVETPLDLDDGLDEIFNNIAENIENGHCNGKKLTVEEIQKINETTPFKSTVKVLDFPLQDQNIRARPTSSVKRKNLFQQRPSFRLSDLYRRFTTKEPINAHQAECDVNMLIECAASVGQPFVDWCNMNAKKFSDIPMMSPGKAIIS